MRNNSMQSPTLVAICQRQGLQGARPFDVSKLNLSGPVGGGCCPTARRFALTSVVLVAAASVLALGVNVSSALSWLGTH